MVTVHNFLHAKRFELLAHEGSDPSYEHVYITKTLLVVGDRVFV